MDIEKVAPEFRTAMTRLPAVPYHKRFLLPVLRLMLRFIGRTQLVDGVNVQNDTFDTVGVRIYRPQNNGSDCALLWIHGGGLVVGSPTKDDRLCSIYARDLKLNVFSVDYRLAPNHRFPAAIDDCYAVWNWLQNNAKELGINPSRIVIGGESAGGGLAASLAQQILDGGGTQPLAQLLFCPMLDDRTAANRELDAEQHYVWNNQNNLGGWSAYLGHAPGQLHEPPYAAASRRESLAGLPPTWLGIGDIDLFYEESRRYVERLESAEVPCSFDVVPMAPHGFQSIAPEAAITREFLQRHYRYLRPILGL